MRTPGIALTWLMLTVPLFAADAPEPLIFWHTQSEDRGELITQIVRDYNATNPPIPVEAIYQGSYDNIYEKTKATLLAGDPPDLAVAYESMIPEYKYLHGVVDLEPLMNDPEIGLSAEEQADIYPGFYESNRYAQFDNALLSFPFTKSLLVFYANEDLVLRAGFERPPRTWEEFVEQCLAMKSIGKRGYAMDIDASTLDGMFFSHGVDPLVADSGATRFDDPGVVAVLDMLRMLVKEGGAYQIHSESNEDVREFVEQECAFIIRSSTRAPFLQDNIGAAFAWSVNPLPRREEVEPVTVLYGANICVFPTTPERERAAWQFIKYFISPEVNARWSVGSGYLPVRKSTQDQPVIQAWFDAHPVNRPLFDLIPLGRVEPTPQGWQEVRSIMQNVTADAIIERGGRTPEQFAQELKVRADAALLPANPANRGITVKILIALVIIGGLVYLVKGLRRRSV